jgi:hypothetical protein
MNFPEISGSPPGGVHRPLAGYPAPYCLAGSHQPPQQRAGWQTSRTRDPEIQWKGATGREPSLSYVIMREQFLVDNSIIV